MDNAFIDIGEKMVYKTFTDGKVWKVYDTIDNKKLIAEFSDYEDALLFAQAKSEEDSVKKVFKRYVPGKFNADDIVHIIGDYGWNNDTLEYKKSYSNDKGYKITIEVERI